jgi:signal transduction histidine kinase
MHTVYAWLRGHPRVVDGMLAPLLFAVNLSGATSAGSVPAEVAAVAAHAVLAATVIVRHRYPVAAFTVAAVIAAAQIGLGQTPGSGNPPVPALIPGVTDAVVLVLLYTLAAYRPRRISVPALVACLVGSGAAVAQWHPAYQTPSVIPGLSVLAGLFSLTLAAWVLGDSMAYRRAYYAGLEDRAARLEAERDAQARIAAAAERARELQEQRARAVEESAARLRRIERDLHDGAQVRLAALALALGEIRENLAAGDDGDTLTLVAAAHENAKQTLTELRDLARGIHPPVLDRGLRPALSALAGNSPIPAAVSVGVAARPSPAIEAIAYFCAAELLANAAKHSGADHAVISLADAGGRLHMTVTDNGKGGARLAPGGGLAGLLERVQAVDGRLTLDSPADGPTIVTIELPCHA